MDFMCTVACALSAACSQDDSKEHGGGFSFPITPPSVVHHEPDSRIFKSWTSVRSSCNSEAIAASDEEDNGPGVYTSVNLGGAACVSALHLPLGQHQAETHAMVDPGIMGGVHLCNLT